MSNDETALRINWYLPINSRMNAPDMPGRIIAQMAIAPDSRMNHHVSGVCDGDATVIHHATAMPHNSETTDAAFQRVTSRGLALRAIKELVPRISRTAPGTTASKVKLLEDEQPEREKILEFQKIMERLIAQELHMKKEGEDQCRDLDETIRNRQLARKEAAAALEKRSRRIRRKHL